MFGSFLPGLWSSSNHSLLGSRSRHCYAINWIRGDSATISCVFLDHAPRVLIVPKSSELRMPQMIAFSPLQEFDLRHEFWSDPNTFLHIVGGQAFTPTRTMRLWQVDEWTFKDHRCGHFQSFILMRS